HAGRSYLPQFDHLARDIACGTPLIDKMPSVALWRVSIVGVLSLAALSKPSCPTVVIPQDSQLIYRILLTRFQAEGDVTTVVRNCSSLCCLACLGSGSLIRISRLRRGYEYLGFRLPHTIDRDDTWHPFMQ